ncbi:hypothetical protein DPX16_9424 [Anabarilius grahami]|uniref:Uncharacterized protein n=1 Tax=Anabarilius grahami TaxID=495550 RepID=A0A3N0Y6M4_ANAGA|nr:hypothetical protein DPX16_9424 [Anabarilius grahami]
MNVIKLLNGNYSDESSLMKNNVRRMKDERMLKCRCDPLVVALGVCLCLCRWSGGRSCGSLRPRYRRTHRSLLGGRASFEHKTDRKRSSAHGFSAPVNGDQAGLERERDDTSRVIFSFFRSSMDLHTDARQERDSPASPPERH